MNNQKKQQEQKAERLNTQSSNSKAVPKSNKDYREAYKEEFKVILEELAKFFKSFAAVKSLKNSEISIGDSLKYPVERLINFRDRVSLLCNEIDRQANVTGLSPDTYQQLWKDQLRATHQLEQIEFVKSYLARIEQSLHKMTMANLAEAVRERGEAARQYYAKNENQQESLKLLQQRFEGENSLGNSAALAEVMDYCSVAEKALQELLAVNKEVVRNEAVGFIKPYQEAAGVFSALKDYIKENKGPMKELVLLTEKYAALSAEVEEECIKVGIVPKATLAGLKKPNFKVELDKYKGLFAHFVSRAKVLDDQIEKHEKESRNAKIKFEKQAGFLQEAAAENIRAVIPDAKAAGGYVESASSLRSVRGSLQKSKDKHNQQIERLETLLGKGSELPWVLSVVGTPTPGHSRSTSADSNASPSFSASDNGNLNLNNAFFAAGKSPIVFNDVSAHTPTPPPEVKGNVVLPHPPSSPAPMSPSIEPGVEAFSASALQGDRFGGAASVTNSSSSVVPAERGPESKGQKSPITAVDDLAAQLQARKSKLQKPAEPTPQKAPGFSALFGGNSTSSSSSTTNMTRTAQQDTLAIANAAAQPQTDLSSAMASLREKFKPLSAEVSPAENPDNDGFGL